MIRRDDASALPVILHHWEAGHVIPNGRLLRHLPSGCVFAVTYDGEEPGAQLVEGQESEDTEELGGMAIGYFRLVGQGVGKPLRRRRDVS
jgi:hypothetical protein